MDRRCNRLSSLEFHKHFVSCWHLLRRGVVDRPFKIASGGRSLWSATAAVFTFNMRSWSSVTHSSPSIRTNYLSFSPLKNAFCQSFFLRVISWKIFLFIFVRGRVSWKYFVKKKLCNCCSSAETALWPRVSSKSGPLRRSTRPCQEPLPPSASKTVRVWVSKHGCEKNEKMLEHAHLWVYDTRSTILTNSWSDQSYQWYGVQYRRWRGMSITPPDQISSLIAELSAQQDQ